MANPGFWRGRRVLLTGHTGFKGAWMSLWLERAGAHLTGLALAPEGRDNLYSRLEPWRSVHSVLSDLRDEGATRRIVAEAKPEIIIHMAAQALVRRSHRDRVGTFSTNIMGTVHLLEAAAAQPGIDAVLVVTSDKVYLNRETGHAFVEDDTLGGDDPYSASKAAAEMVVRAYRRDRPALGVARGGNVIGGGDWAEDRLVPDVIRAGADGRQVELRYPHAVRPWQHVLDVVAGYLAYAERLATHGTVAPAALNFGPAAGAPSLTTSGLVERLQSALGWTHGWIQTRGPNPLEKTELALDCSAAERALAWQPKLDLATALAWVADWHRAHAAGEDMRTFSVRQIDAHQARSAAATFPTVA